MNKLKVNHIFLIWLLACLHSVVSASDSDLKCTQIRETLDEIQTRQDNFKLADMGTKTFKDRQENFNAAMAKLALYNGLLTLNNQFKNSLASINSLPAAPQKNTAIDLTELTSIKDSIELALPRARKMAAMHFVLSSASEQLEGKDFLTTPDEKIIQKIREQCLKEKENQLVCSYFKNEGDELSKSLKGFIQAYKVAHSKSSDEQKKVALAKYRKILEEGLPNSSDLIENVLKLENFNDLKKLTTAQQQLSSDADQYLECKKKNNGECSDTEVRKKLTQVSQVQHDIRSTFKITKNDLLKLDDFIAPTLVDKIQKIIAPGPQKSGAQNPLNSFLAKLNGKINLLKDIKISDDEGKNSTTAEDLNKTLLSLCNKQKLVSCESYGAVFNQVDGALKIKDPSKLQAFLDKFNFDNAEFKKEIAQLKATMATAQEWITLNFNDKSYRGLGYFQSIFVEQLLESCGNDNISIKNLEVCDDNQQSIEKITQVIDSTGKILQKFGNEQNPSKLDAYNLCLSGDARVLTKKILDLCNGHFPASQDKFIAKLKAHDQQLDDAKISVPNATIKASLVDIAPVEGKESVLNEAEGVQETTAKIELDNVIIPERTNKSEEVPEVQAEIINISEAHNNDSDSEEQVDKIKGEITEVTSDRKRGKRPVHHDDDDDDDDDDDNEDKKETPGRYSQYVDRDYSNFNYSYDPLTRRTVRSPKPHPGWGLAAQGIGIAGHLFMLGQQNNLFEAQLDASVQTAKYQTQYAYNLQQYNMYMYNQAYNYNQYATPDPLLAGNFYYPFFQTLPATTLPGISQPVTAGSGSSYFNFSPTPGQP